MNVQADKTPQNKSQSAADSVSQLQMGFDSAFQLEDKRPEAIVQRKLQQLVQNRPEAKQLKAFQQLTNNKLQSKQVVQRTIEVVGDKTYNAGDEDAFKAKYPTDWENIFDSLGEFGNRPKDLNAALADKRHFKITKDGEGEDVIWIPKLTEVAAVAGGGNSREADGEGVLVMRPAASFEEIKIKGLIMCVGIIIEAKGAGGLVVAAAGAHFVTPACMEKEAKAADKQDQKTPDTYKLTPQGIALLAQLRALAGAHGNLSAILLTAEGAGAAIAAAGAAGSAAAAVAPARKSGAEEDAAEAVKLIKAALGMPTVELTGDSNRSYKLKADGSSTV